MQQGADRMRRVILPLLAILAASPLRGGLKPQAGTPTAPADSARYVRFERQLEDLRQRLKIPGISAGIVRDGELTWSRGFGYSDPGMKAAAAPETPYEIASLSKPFGATLLMQLVEEGKVRLD